MANPSTQDASVPQWILSRPMCLQRLWRRPCKSQSGGKQLKAVRNNTCSNEYHCLFHSSREVPRSRIVACWRVWKFAGTRKKARSKRKRDDSGEVQPSACYTDNGIGDAPGSRSSDMRSRDQDVTASLRSKELEVVNRQLVPVASPQKEFQTDDCTRPSEMYGSIPLFLHNM